MKKHGLIYLVFCIKLMCLMQISIRVEAQDTVSFLKKNQLGLTINGLAPDEAIPGSGVSLHYAKWKNINYAHKYGLHWQHLFKHQRMVSEIVNINGQNLIKTRVINATINDFTISYGQIFSKHLFTKLSIYATYDIQLGITKSNYIDFSTFDNNNIPLNEFNSLTYIGAVLQIIPAVGMKWQIGKRVGLISEVSMLPMRFTYMNDGSLTGDIGYGLSARFGLTISF